MMPKKHKVNSNDHNDHYEKEKYSGAFIHRTDSSVLNYKLGPPYKANQSRAVSDAYFRPRSSPILIVPAAETVLDLLLLE